MSQGGNLTEILRHTLRYARVCVTGALQPRGLVHSALGEIAVPACVEVVSIRTLSAVVVSVTCKSPTQRIEHPQRAALGRFRCNHSDPGGRRPHLDCRQR